MVSGSQLWFCSWKALLSHTGEVENFINYSQPFENPKYERPPGGAIITAVSIILISTRAGERHIQLAMTTIGNV